MRTLWLSSCTDTTLSDVSVQLLFLTSDEPLLVELFYWYIGCIPLFFHSAACIFLPELLACKHVRLFCCTELITDRFSCDGMLLIVVSI